MRYHTNMKKNLNRHSEPITLLGGISAETFLKDYWHKKPLLVRGAIPAFSLAAEKHEEFSSPISAQTLFHLASDELVESRLVQADPWRFNAGPFKKKSLPKLEDHDWTLLFQGMEAHHPAAEGPVGAGPRGGDGCRRVPCRQRNRPWVDINSRRWQSARQRRFLRLRPGACRQIADRFSNGGKRRLPRAGRRPAGFGEFRNPPRRSGRA